MNTSIKKTAVIVQCRLSSSRLPGKALKKLGNEYILSMALNSMKKVPADRYFVATDKDSYETLEPVCENSGFECFAGDLNDVLKRFCDLIKIIDCENIVRATADNPFLFYEAAAESLELFKSINKDSKQCDYLTYSGLPHGSGVEIFSGSSLLKAASETADAYDHEHVGPAFYKHQDKYNCRFIPAPERYNHPLLRTTIDTYSDYLRGLRYLEYLKQKNETAPYTTEAVIEAAESDFVKNPVVFAPCVKKGHGTGHLHRCLQAAKDSSSFVFINPASDLEEKDSVINEYISQGLNPQMIIDSLPDENYKAVVISDSFKLSQNEADLYRQQKSFISIDEGSEFADYADYLLDIIPSKEYTRKPNLFETAFIAKPANVKKIKSSEKKKILICIGGEDPSNLTGRLCQITGELLKASEITVITSKNIKLNNERVIVTGPVKNLREQLYKYDLVITHYGLTAFEAASCGCQVLLCSTTKLHEKLASDMGFAYIPYGEITKEKVKKAFENSSLFPEKIINSENKNLGRFSEELAKGIRYLCPVCQKEDKPSEIVSRNINRTYRRCRNCGLVYISWSKDSQMNYGKAYFFEDYKKQYGKTYQDDFESIKAQCIKRIDEINKISPVAGKSVLDIGCAYGPFLSAAKDKQMNPYGTDISQDAVEFVKDKLNIPACASAFPDFDSEKALGITQFDMVTMWYVIEHFKDLNSVLTKVSQLVKKEGIFAFSTPSGEGVSATTDKDHFYTISPVDHFSVWEPSKANEILNRYGFEVVSIVSTGHHPERFPEIKESGAEKGSELWNKIYSLSREKNLGDTVEIYCRKIK